MSDILKFFYNCSRFIVGTEFQKNRERLFYFGVIPIARGDEFLKTKGKNSSHDRKGVFLLSEE
jgi:hypothetical protein